MGRRVASAQGFQRIPLIVRQLRSRGFAGSGRRAIVARAPNPQAGAKPRGIGAAAMMRELVGSSSFLPRALSEARNEGLTRAGERAKCSGDDEQRGGSASNLPLTR